MRTVETVGVENRRRSAGPDATSSPVAPAPDGEAGSRFSAQLMHAAAAMYYLEDATQAEIADRLGTSRPTVSRLLSEARRLGIVRIEVVAPDQSQSAELAERTRQALDLDQVHLAAYGAAKHIGAALAPAVSRALSAVRLAAGDILLVSSGRMVYEVALNELPSLPGVVVVPTVGGQDEPEPWYQTNEITRMVAHRVSGTPNFLYAPALPGPGLYEVLLNEPSIQRVVNLWDSAACAVVGIGAPPLIRDSIPRFVPTDAVSLRAAVGDVCSRFFDRDGNPVDWPGTERLIALPLETIRKIPVSIGVAVGQAKLRSIIAAARAGYINQLVTDAATAEALVLEAAAHSL